LFSAEQFKETGHFRTAGTKWTGEQLKETGQGRIADQGRTYETNWPKQNSFYKLATG
jgi:hypothetical protein